MEATAVPNPKEKQTRFQNVQAQFMTSLCLVLQIFNRFKTYLAESKLGRMISPHLPEWDFLSMHWTYFETMSLFWSIVLYVTSRPFCSILYIDCLFISVSAITCTGLTPVDLSTMNTAQQIILCLLFPLGSHITISLAVVRVRMRAFEKRFREIFQQRHLEQQQAEEAAARSAAALTGNLNPNTDETTKVLSPPCDMLQDQVKSSDWRYFWRSAIARSTSGRNSAFHNLTKQERESQVCVEYDSLTLLFWVVSVYLSTQFLAGPALGAYFAWNKADVIGRNGVNPWWLGVFNAVSAFNNAGMSLMDLSMIPFQTARFPVVLMSVLMLAGNTGYPIFLRLIIWAMSRILKLFPDSPYWNRQRATVEFTLKYPRRVYTHLFGKWETWFLVGILVTLNSIDWFAFEKLNSKDPELLLIPAEYRAQVGLFQALTVRCSGFTIVNIALLASGVLALYIGMMYISALPVTITMRSSNVYEERSLGIYTAKKPAEFDLERGDPDQHALPKQNSRRFYISKQVEAQLGYDIWSIVGAAILITFIEQPPIEGIFPIIFEVFSAYANIGLSMGAPGHTYSLCGTWHTVSKLCLIFLNLRGRHRSLPVAIDRAIQLPDRDIGSREDEDEREREHQLERQLHRKTE